MFLRRIIDGLNEAQEDGVLLSELRGKTFYVLLVLAILLLSLGYQVRIPSVIDVGGQGDEVYLRGFYGIETTNDVSYRWSSDRSSILLPGIGGCAPARLRLRLNGSRPATLAAPRASLKINGRELTSFVVSEEFETYDFPIAPRAIGLSGDLEVEIDSEFFVPNDVLGGGDLRELGVLVDFVSVDFQGSLTSPVTPAPAPMFYLAGGAIALYLLARWVLSKRGALALAILLLAGLSLGLAVKRIYVTHYASWILIIPALGVLIMELARRGPTMAKGVLFAGALVLGSLFGLRQFASMASLVGMGIAPDFANNYAAATLLRDGGLIYNVDEPLFAGYDNPPLTAILMVPFTLLGLQTAIRLFFLLNVILLCTCVALVFVSRREYLLRYPYWLIALALVLNLDPVRDSILLGQLDLVILTLIVVSYWASRNSYDTLAGSSLGLAAMIRISPALIILYFLVKRRFRVFGSACVTAVLIAALSLFIAGSETHILFVTRILPTLVAGSAQLENQSLNGFFNRLFLDASFTTDLAEVAPLPEVRVLTLLASLLLIGTTAFLILGKLTPRDDLRFDLEYSLVVTCLPLISTIAWHHYMTWYVLPFLLLLNPRLRRWVPERSHLILAAAGFLFYTTLCVPITSYAANFLKGPAELVISVRLYGALAFYGIFTYLLKHYPDVDSQAKD